MNAKHMGFTLVELPAVSRGFTLVELLVVVTIIALLMALIAPALDRAIYQAQLTVCSAQQKTIGNSTINYTLDHKRRYPYQDACDMQDSNWQAVSLYYHVAPWAPNTWDQRPKLRPYMDINKLFNDPLVAKVVLDNTWDAEIGNTDDTTSDVVATMGLWAGFKYWTEKGMLRLGDRWEYARKPYDILVCDRDVVGGPIQVPNGFNNPEGWIKQGTLKTAGVKAAGVQSSHPDSRNILTNEPIQDGKHPWGGANINLTISYWLNLDGLDRRGLVDTNYTYQDLSVHRYTGIEWRDERMTIVSTMVDRTSGGPQQMPRN